MPDASMSADDSSDCTNPELARALGLVQQYDSMEDPQLRSDFLDAMGITRPVIDNLRRFIARENRKAAQARAMDSGPGVEKGEVGHEFRQKSRIRPKRRSQPMSGPPGRKDIRRHRRRVRISRYPKGYLVIIIPLP
ncbi:hypothetical protein [Streptomyces chilikensis]|uniref:hypothetical protein n=1 Tax=Streptomyces chilikensis TaxID=1194079 RepID=UPI000ABC3021|nr:hypothetical protein [Streptomyces chilikensis]